MSEIVAKFGGTSMAQPEVVADIVLSDQERSYVIVSAPGKRHPGDEKVTDLLISYGDKAMQGIKDAEAIDEIIGRYNQAFAGIDAGRRSKLANKIASFLSEFGMSGDYYASLGERFSAEYFAELCGGVFVNSPIRFTGKQLDKPATRQAISELKSTQSKRPLIIPGFYGYDDFGNIQVLNRGGSDRTSVLISDALGLPNENWTDVDGIFTADPRDIPEAKAIKELTRAEVREGAHGGSEVLQGDCIVDANGTNFDITLRNTFNLSAPGTRILTDRTVDPNHPVMAVSSRDLSEVHITDLGMADTPGYLGRILHEAGLLGISAEHFPVAQDSTTITFTRGTEPEDIYRFATAVEKTLLSKHGEISIDEDKAVVYVVGEALRDRRISNPVLNRIIHELGSKSLYFDDIVSNYRSPSLALLVDRSERKAVQQVVFDEFLAE